MLRGIYTSANGMQVEKQMHEVLADNIANTNTNGYKSYKLIHQASEDQDMVNSTTGKLMGKISQGAEVYSTSFDMAQGPIKQTGNPLDLGISGDGFFAVQDRQAGQTVYTRNGHFTLDLNGFLVNQHGDQVLDAGQAPVFIGLNDISKVTVSQDGVIMVDGSYNTTIKPFLFPEGAAMLKKSNDKFAPGTEDIVMQVNNDAVIEQGFIETSNVSAIRSTAEMVQVMRSFEANEKALRTQADTLEMLMGITDGI